MFIQTCRGHAKGMAKNDHLTIEVVTPEGKPLYPRKNAIKFVHQCGVVVRDLVPISTREWKKPKKEGVSYVDDKLKILLWEKLIRHFTLPEVEDDDEAGTKTKALRDKVKHWALKKMAEQFNKFKNRIWKEYKEKGKIPKFESTLLEKQRGHWDAFLEYKNSETYMERSKKNKANAAQKKYHHNMGPTGYAGNEPKWEAAEAQLRLKELPVPTENWPRRARNWILGHGRQYDMATGNLVPAKKVKNPPPCEAIVEAIKEAQDGKFIPDREMDELTKALGNKEKGGRVRGLGPHYNWLIGFPEAVETYRSRERGKKRKEEALLEQHESQLHEIWSIVRDQQTQLNKMRGQGRADDHVQQDSQPSTGVGASGDAPMDRYPVDNIREKTPCELHVPVRNLSFKVADGYALTCEGNPLWHCNPIPAGYGRVGVDEIMDGYHDLELDIPGAEGERLLGEVDAGIILWKKKYIVFPGSTPRPPPSSPPSRHSAPPSPHDEERDGHHSASPTTTTEPTMPPPEPTPPPRQPTPPREATPPRPSKQKRTSSSTKRRRKTREEPLPKVPKLPPKRAYDMTPEENKEVVDKEVREFFLRAKKKAAPEPKQIFTEKEKQWAKGFLEHPSQVEINKPNDYLRALSRVKPSKKRGVAQLGEQSKQSISPLKVYPSEMYMTAEERFARDAGISLAQAIGDAPISAPTKLAWTWKKGKSLVPEDEIPRLPTQMRRLHEWYMKAVEQEKEMILMKITHRHFKGEDEVSISFEELFQLYKMDALCVSIVSSFCL